MSEMKLAAVIELARGHLARYVQHDGSSPDVIAARDSLASADTDAALREVRAKALEDFAERCTAAGEHVGGMNTIAAFATAEAERIREDR